MPRDMKPIGPGRMDALKSMMGGGGPAPEAADYDDATDTGADLASMVDTLEMDVLPTADGEKRQHLEKAISELKMCMGGGEKEPKPEAPAEDDAEGPESITG